MIRRLVNSDQNEVETFLSQHIETSMFILSNIRKKGLDYHGGDFEGEYFGAFDTDGLKGLIVHSWNNIIMVQAPQPDVLSDLYQALITNMTRPFAGILGHVEQGQYILDKIQLDADQFATNHVEDLYKLDLSALKIPKITDAKVQMVVLEHRHFDLAVAWMKAYDIEALGAQDNDRLMEKSITSVKQRIEIKNTWVLEVDGVLVSLSGFNAELDDIVQIGPVWTPPEHRSKSYARALVALTLEHARTQGVKNAILFTSSKPARKAYQAIGFEHSGQFQLSLLKNPIDISR